jgi:hypothetical protein
MFEEGTDCEAKLVPMLTFYFFTYMSACALETLGHTVVVVKQLFSSSANSINIYTHNSNSIVYHKLNAAIEVDGYSVGSIFIP